MKKIRRKHWGRILAIRHLVVRGIRYDISHLLDTIYPVVLKRTANRPELRLYYIVHFRSHCVSRGAKIGETLDFCILREDSLITDEKGDYRFFDVLRRKLSRLLPGIMSTLPERRWIPVSRKTWLTTEIVEVDGASKEYEIYFNIAKRGKRKLHITVVSAYVRDQNYGNTKQTHPRIRRFLPGKLVIAKTIRGEKIM